MLRVVFEPLDVFEWDPALEYGSTIWDELEAWCGEPLEQSSDGTVTFRGSVLCPGDVLVKARTSGAAVFVVNREYYERHYITTPTLPQP